MIQRHSASTGRSLGPTAEFSPLTVPELPPRVSGTREVALTLLSQMGAPAVPTFQDLLKNADALATIEIIRVLPAMGKDHTAVFYLEKFSTKARRLCGNLGRLYSKKSLALFYLSKL